MNSFSYKDKYKYSTNVTIKSVPMVTKRIHIFKIIKVFLPIAWNKS